MAKSSKESIEHLGFQLVGLMCISINEELEEAMKGCNSFSSIRSTAEKRKELKEGLMPSLSHKALLSQFTQCLHLKEMSHL